jgi:hypothetical protein
MRALRGGGMTQTRSNHPKGLREFFWRSLASPKLNDPNGSPLQGEYQDCPARLFPYQLNQTQIFQPH